MPRRPRRGSSDEREIERSQAAADAYEARICLVTSYDDKGIVRVDPEAEAAAWRRRRGDDEDPRTLWLSFWAEVHYSSIVPLPPEC